MVAISSSFLIVEKISENVIVVAVALVAVIAVCFFFVDDTKCFCLEKYYSTFLRNVSKKVSSSKCSKFKKLMLTFS